MEFEFSAGAAVYTYRNKKRYYLFLNREDFIDLPKGHVEKGETSEQAALREIKEESGLSVELNPYFRDETEYWFMRGKEKIKKHVTVFLARVPADSKVKISWEHKGYEWLTYDEAVKKFTFENQRRLGKRINDYIDRLELMEELNKEYAALPKKHKNWDLSGRYVPGHGPLNAKVMFVGQAPGRNEDIQGKPFIGMAGKLLDQLIHRAGLKREKVYISSIVQFFPPDNRLPTEEEAKHCMPFLKRQIAIVKPELIIALGNFAALNLVGITNVMQNHGKIVESKEFGCKVFISMHPAAAVRIRTNIPVMEKDFDKLKSLLTKLKFIGV